MNARIQATGILGVMFVGMSAVYYEVGISNVATVHPVLKQINEIHQILISSSDEALIQTKLIESNLLYNNIRGDLT